MQLSSTLKKIQELESGALSAEENVSRFIEKIEKDKYGAFLEVYSERALAQARKVDARRKKGGKLPPLAGLAVGVKNSIAVKGQRLTCASKMLEDYVAPYDATAIERIEAAGGVLVGSTNLDEFCCGSDCTRSALAKTCNPLDTTRVVGGSSGGSAAAVAAGLCDTTLSEDTGGSIRCPASFCGVTGVRPTYGTVSRYGVSDMAMSFDQLGPISSDVLGSAALLQELVGSDPRDATTVAALKQDFVSSLNNLPNGLRAAVPKQFFEGCDPGVESLVRKKIELLESKGVKVEEIDFPLLSYSLPVYYLLVFSEFASAMQKYDGLRYGADWAQGTNYNSVAAEVRSANLGSEVKRRILLGTYITTKEFRGAWYSKTLKARDLLRKEFAKVFKSHDVVLGPTMPMTAWKIGEKSQDPLQMYLADILTVPANCAGLSGASIPAGMHNKTKMPVGFQVIGKWNEEATLLKVLAAAED
ncbi:glutaminyl-tRNA synthase (glutamine-hydrolyzing) subunit A [Candidatus Micrarchaeota archaeon CG1_02_55_22]|nr:MAG: glutaminyl-tRNA synthase (glutamine-hydrolyzing) subunit A [Candidatus Micrarchaeota archaeon CG1_02_55_22]